MADLLEPIREANLPSNAAVNLKDLSTLSIKESIPDDVLKASLATPPFVPLDGSLNLRDIGLLPGSLIKPGLIYRSGSLHNVPSSAFPRLRDELGIKIIFDLRQEGERQRFPEPEIPGVNGVWMKTQQPLKRIDLDEFAAEGGIPGFVSMYTDILHLHAANYKRILEYLRDHPGDGILWHCAAGKDRAGVFAMLLHGLVGHDAELTGYDYSLTRVGIESDRATLTKNLEDWLGKGGMDKPGMQHLSSTRPEIAYAFLDAVQEQHGGLWNFCKTEMGLTQEDLVKVVKNIKKV